MKSRSLFDTDAWVNRPFKPTPTPQTPIVTLRPVAAEKKPKPEPIIAIKPEPAVPYGESYSPAVRRIVEMVAKVSGFPVYELKGKSKAAPFVDARQIIMFLARRFTDRSLPVIGQELGGRNHTTCLHGEKKIERIIRERKITRPGEDTPEAWAMILLAELRTIRAEIAVAYRERQSALLPTKYERLKAARAARRAQREAKS
jgi:hypothetical protein